MTQIGRGHMVGRMDGWRQAHAAVRVLGCLAVVGSGVAIAACDDDDEILFVDVNPIVESAVVTFVDSTYSFAGLHTFAMPDTVVHLVPRTGTPLAVTGQYDQVALDRVR